MSPPWDRDVIEHVAIVGGGFSGSLAAINLVRHDGPRATLIDRQADAGTGLAYGAADPAHLLNVRASNMSAFPDDPGHFVRWLEEQGYAAVAQTFVPRLVYGDYLKAVLAGVATQNPDRLRIVRGEVVDVVDSAGVQVVLADGTRLAADAAILAVGNLPPHAPAGLDLDAIAPSRYAGDCWAASATEGLGRDDTVLVLGTGLTMVDVALLLDAKGFAGRIVALSRRGLLPHAHTAPGAPWVAIKDRPGTRLSQLVRTLRMRSTVIGWRSAVDELRPFTQHMWHAASAAERARFIRHARPWWDIHRHRLAPPVADRIAALRSTGRLALVAGKIERVAMGATGVDVTWRPRGSAASQPLNVQWIINCTGPQGDLRRTGEPVLRQLTTRGAIRPDAAQLGIDVDEQMRVIGRDGRPNDRLFALGPMTRGAFWEIVAVPDIRTQAWTLARRLSNAHWVAEGL
ncbi:FAD/NAD(P)-binding protein [Sphingomonas sp. CARO-RG-8B-R24-01]|uniref:FAD/NAD(P)-binding protein n=1 Tax=Sphingomonas sp. CARO-RG-8B-R24-01 TaxID=2914831 RepID=UPI001F5A4C6B|nr:FAD/NAD(P)-binding protein [Sphingomonas sp. CARO-RG-8B-R24-01]